MRVNLRPANAVATFVTPTLFATTIVLSRSIGLAEVEPPLGRFRLPEDGEDYGYSTEVIDGIVGSASDDAKADLRFVGGIDAGVGILTDPTEDEIIEKRDAMIGSLEKRLVQRVDSQTLFTIRWEVV